MPAAIALAGAAFSVATGASAIAAGSTLLGGLTIASGALGAIGALTGNKKLATIGGALGIAGGATSLLTNASGGATGGATSALTDTAKATTGNTVSDMVKAPGVQVADAGGGLPAGALPSPAAETAAGVIGSQGVGQGGGTFALNDLGYQPPVAGAGGGGLVGGAAQDSNWWGKAADWVKGNPELSKAGFGLVGGAFDYMGKNQFADDAMKRQMTYQDWIRQRYSDSVRNLTIPSPANGGIIQGSRG